MALMCILMITACKKDIDKVETLTMDKSEITLRHDSSLQLAVIPNQICIWTSSDTNVAKVTQTGLVTGVRLGNAKISAKAVSGLLAECDVNLEATYYIYAEPYFKYGESVDYVKGMETRTLILENSTGLSYSGENSNVISVIYFFQEDSLVAADVMLNTAEISSIQVKKFLDERYIYWTTQDYISFYMDNSGNIIALNAYENSGLDVMYYSIDENKGNRNSLMEGYLNTLKYFKQ